MHLKRSILGEKWQQHSEARPQLTNNQLRAVFLRLRTNQQADRTWAAR